MESSKVLGEAIKADLGETLVIALDRNGKFYFAGTTSDIGKIILMLEIAKADMVAAAVEETL